MAFDPAQILTNALSDDLTKSFAEQFPDAAQEYTAFLRDAVSLATKHLTQTSASYHDADHTVMVVMAGQDILRGKALNGTLRATDWIHGITAMLFHDIGYSRTACRDDIEGVLVTDSNGGRLIPEAGKSDAILAPYHVDRGMIFVKEHFAASDIVDAERLSAAINYTRFPVPEAPEYSDVDSEPGLVRAADLIGQLADPLYPQKLTNLYYEMLETGAADALGYGSALDMVDAFPQFFQGLVEPLLGPAVHFLEQTPEGAEWAHRLQRLVALTASGELQRGPFKG